jgi:GntR family transcriptional regulator, arabinose operon transcriptional repressor
LAEQYGCNYHTVRHAFQKLAEEGFITLSRGSCTFIAERAEETGTNGGAIEKGRLVTDRLGVLLLLRQWGHYVSSLIEQLHISAEARGIQLNIRTVSDINAQSVAHVRSFQEQECCAVILPWVGVNQGLGDLFEFVRASELPVVVPNPVHGLDLNCYRDPRADLDTNHTGTYLQCRYFQELGFKNIALLGPSYETAEFFERKLLQYSRWVDRANLPNLIGLVDDSMSGYERVIERWGSMKGDLAVIAYHDEMAMDFMNACQRMGYSIPEDIAVLGHNNNPAGLCSNPALSTMLCPYNYIADGMISHALALADGSSAQLTGSMPQAFYIRESCAGRLRMGDKVDGVVKALLAEFRQR